MSAHKFKVGQMVHFMPGRTAMIASSREYQIVRQLPPEGGQNQYRIKGVSETFERMARESELQQANKRA